jgi:hypothetical protein
MQQWLRCNCFVPFSDRLVLLSHSHTLLLVPAGTVAYMAPECFDPRIGGVTGKVDVFSFSIMLWEVREASAGQSRPCVPACDYML